MSSDTLSNNHTRRIKQNPFTADYPLIIGVSCYEGAADLIFLDNKGYLIGEYEFKTDDVDRLITEVELYQKIENAGEFKE